MGAQFVSVSNKSGIWYGNVHKPTTSGGEDIMPIYVRVEDGTWREDGKHGGGRPDESMEKLLEWAAGRAEEQGKSEIRAQWTEQGMKVVE